jgi:hypothetical protein
MMVETPHVINIAAILFIGFILGVLFTAVIVITGTSDIVSHIKVDQVTFSFNETAAINTMFKAMEERGLNFTELYNTSQHNLTERMR